MNLHEFCSDRRVCENFALLRNRDSKAKEFLADQMGRLIIEYKEITPALRLHGLQINANMWELYREDLQQKLICKLLDDRLRSFRASHGRILPYLTTIIVRMVIDENRNTAKKTTGITEQDMDSISFAFWHSHAEKAQLEGHSCTIALQEERHREVQMQTCLRRVILKLWRPYFFNYHFEPDEIRFLETRKNSVPQLQ